jgi:hypothetical protein
MEARKEGFCGESRVVSPRYEYSTASAFDAAGIIEKAPISKIDFAEHEQEMPRVVELLRNSFVPMPVAPSAR